MPKRTYEIPVLWGKISSKLGQEMRRMKWEPTGWYKNGMKFTVNGREFTIKMNDYENDNL